MKKIFFLLLLFLLWGCGKSLMKLTMKADPEPYGMFGKSPSRSFYVPVQVSDSLNLLWEESANGSFPNSSVSVYDEFVFINDLSGRVFAYNISTGKQAGMLKYKGAVYSTPLVFKTAIIFPVVLEKDNITELVFYDYQEGKEIEVKEISGKVISEMIALNESIVFLTDEGSVYKYTIFGSKEWETHTETSTHCSPSVVRDKIIFGNDAGEVIALKLEDGEDIYKKKIDGIFSGAPSVDGNTFYISNENGKIYSIDAGNGKVNWEFNSGARILMTPAIDDKNVIFGNLSGELFLLNKSNGKLNWKSKAKGILNSTPLITSNRIIIADSFLAYYLIDKSNGKIIKEIPLEGRAKLTPVFFKDILFIGYDNGILRAYEFIN